MACGVLPGGLSRVATGTPNAAVFPLPVFDWMIRSSPDTAAAKTARCTGVGAVKPSSRIPRRTLSGTSSSSKLPDVRCVQSTPSTASSTASSAAGFSSTLCVT